MAARPDWVQFSFVYSIRGLVGVAASIGLGAVLLRRPDAGLLLLSGFVYLNLSQVLVRYHGLPSLLRLLAVPVLLAAWAARDREAVRRVIGAPLTLLLVGYSVVLLASTLWAQDTLLADECVSESLKGFIIYFAVALSASSARVVRRGAWVMVASGAFLAALAALQMVGNLRDEYGGLARIKYAHIYGRVFEPRVAGPLGDPNFFAQVLVLAVPVALFLAWSARGQRERLLALAGAGLLMLGTMLTYSRGGALALGCVTLLALSSRHIRPRQVLLGVALLGALAAAAPGSFTRRLTTLEQILPGSETVLRPDSSFQKRRLLVGAAWRMFLDHPLVGVGAGNYTVHFEQYADEVGSAARDYEEPDARHFAHNLYLEIGAETGLVGLFVFGLAVWTGLLSLRETRRRFTDSGDAGSAALARGFELAMLAYLIAGLFLHGDFQRYLWLCFGFATALATLAAGENALRTEPVP